MTYLSDPKEYEEYVSTMNAMSDAAHASAPDPTPEDFKQEDQAARESFIMGKHLGRDINSF